MNIKSALGFLRLIALLEGISFLSFIVTMPLKYGYDIALPNKIVGMLHGFLFILYVGMVYWVNTDVKWSLKQQLGAYLASILPFGTFVADAKLFRNAEIKPKSEELLDN